MDLDIKPVLRQEETWLEPEDMCYPLGGFTRRARVRITRNQFNPREDLPYGELRTVRASIPDTAFSIPARLQDSPARLR